MSSINKNANLIEIFKEISIPRIFSIIIIYGSRENEKFIENIYLIKEEFMIVIFINKIFHIIKYTKFTKRIKYYTYHFVLFNIKYFYNKKFYKTTSYTRNIWSN